MPTYNRRHLIGLALRCFERQTHPEKELIVVDDGECIADILPAGTRYIRLGQRHTTGAKRNMGCAAARGEIICNWDDDDWSHPQRIASQIGLLKLTGKYVTGYSSTIYWNEADGLVYKNPGPIPALASGTSQCYLKSWWRLHGFPEKSIGEDSEFSEVARAAGVLDAGDCGQMMVARAHKTSTCKIDFSALRPLAPGLIPPGFLTDLEACPAYS